VLEQSRRKQEGNPDVKKRYKYRLIKKSGEIVWINNFSKTITYKGRPANLVMTEDITEKIMSEQKLKESEEKFKYLFNNAQVGLYWSRISDGKFMECNETFAKLFGYNTREECLADYIATEHYVDPYQREEILEAIRTNGEVRGYEIYVTKRDGTPIWLSISARMDEKENRIEGAAIDITKRKKAEQELIESEERYKRAYDKADFYKDLLAHDVSNILNNINASVQLMKIWKDNHNLSAKERDMLEIIKQQLKRGASLVSNVRKLSEIEESEKIVKILNVSEVINQSIKEINSRFHEKDIEISLIAPQDNIKVRGGELLIDAFENLLINGATHNDSEKIRMWINLTKINQQGKNYVKIEFKDNGIGIVDDRKKPIFERNYNKDRSTGGMGIGLSLVKTIINNYDGQVWVENRIKEDFSQGSNFVVVLKEG
jgi:PAS domain S-box-containing protein